MPKPGFTPLTAEQIAHVIHDAKITIASITSGRDKKLGSVQLIYHVRKKRYEVVVGGESLVAMTDPTIAALHYNHHAGLD